MPARLRAAHCASRPLAPAWARLRPNKRLQLRGAHTGRAPPVARAAAREFLPTGARWRFAPSGEILQAVATTIEAERTHGRQASPHLRVPGRGTRGL